MDDPHADDIGPQDSASQVSQANTSSSNRSKIKARCAILKAKAATIQRRHALEVQEQKLKQEREQLEIEEELAVLQAEAESESEVQFNPKGRSNLTNSTVLNPQAAEYVPSASVDKVERHKQLLAAIHLPQAQIMMFDGNPLKYYTFIKTFENSVERVCVDEESKLTRLLQYCTSKASDIIQCCALMRPEEGYRQARKLLQERFGNSYKIVEAWIEKVTVGKAIGSGDTGALREYADDLRACEMTLKAMDSMTEVGTQRVLVKLVERLPYYLRMRWVREVRDVRQRRGRSADFSDLVSFVEGAAEEAADPVYGRLISQKGHSGSGNPTGTANGGRRFGSVSLVAARTGCVMCDGSHNIYMCDRFKQLQVEARVKFAREKGLCFLCLKSGHRVNACSSSRTCTVQGCGRRHSQLLHKTATAGRVDRQHVPPIPQNESSNFRGNETSMANGAGNVQTALPLVPVKVWASDNSCPVMTYALLDSGSTTSFCTSKLATCLGVEGRPAESLVLSTLGQKGGVFEMPVLSLKVSDIDGDSLIDIGRVYATRELPISSQHRMDMDEVGKWSHLKDIVLPGRTAGDEVDLLIGQDVPEALAPLEVRLGGPRAPYAIRTMLGWTVQGPVKGGGEHTAFVNFVRNDTELHQRLERFWKLDFGDDTVSDVKGMSVEDRRALSVMEETTNKVDGHYELAIPFKERPVDLPNNRSMADLRLQSLSRKLSQNPELHERYCDGMADMLSKGYAEKVPDDEVNRDDRAVWYLPHHAVAKKADKIRIVFDCAARYKGVSLNDLVLQGPDLTNSLIAVLMRFRQEPVAVMADVEAMFNQVRVVKSDRDVLRFLWWPGGDQTLEPETYRMNVHLFGGTWSPSCSNFALRRTAAENSGRYSPEVVDAVQRNFYVDDCLKSLKSEDRAIALVQGLTDLLKQGGFKLTKWVSTSDRVLESVPEADRSQRVSINLLDEGHLATEKALGLSWNVRDDCFMFKINKSRSTLTRRGLLSTVCSIYDPLGFVCPCTLVAKKIMQDLTRKQVSWDEPLPEAELSKWQSWFEDLVMLELVSVPRCLKSDVSEDIHCQLHHFADASCMAYGVVTYLRVENTSRSATCSLMMAKSRLTPVKTVTLPRLELMAATLAVKMDQQMRRELDLPLSRSVFWTDSTIVLQYIRNEQKRFHIFVANRVATIRNASSPEDWRYVPTKENPADDVSRGLTAIELVGRDRWWNGPRFLCQTEEQWPACHHLDVLSNDDPEVKHDAGVIQTFSTVSKTQQNSATDRLFSRRSNWMKLKCDVAWILRFIAYLKNRSDPQMSVKTGKLDLDDLQSAENAILRYTQRQCFQREIDKIIRQTGRIQKCSLSRLDPVMMHDGLLCVGGRLKNAPVPLISRHPVILPKRHHIVDLIVRYEHESSAHTGREYLLSLLRQKYWIIKGRAAVRGILSSCVTCRRAYGHCGEQKMADLPVDRVSPDSPPFSYVGVDLFGPFAVKQGRSLVKRYGCLFTCLTIRAIHIEVVHSLDTDSFLNALLRFISRRGRPVEIRSDNATNFRSGDRELGEAVSKWNQGQISKFLVQREIRWKYNPPSASHMGGVWERQIRSVRKVLNVLLREQSLNDESLNTVMCQAELVVNSRPITPVSDDARDLEALTPLHLLTLRQELVLPPGIFHREDNYCRRRWKQVQYISDVFWRRWTREYLPLLQARSKWHTASRDFRPGDVVLLAEDSPRCIWPLARITAVTTSPDGHVRSVTLKTRYADSVTRPVTKICLLEQSAADC